MNIKLLERRQLERKRTKKKGVSLRKKQRQIISINEVIIVYDI